MIRGLIADDQTIAREGLRQVLAVWGDFCVAGEAVNGAQVMAALLFVFATALLLSTPCGGRGHD